MKKLLIAAMLLVLPFSSNQADAITAEDNMKAACRVNAYNYAGAKVRGSGTFIDKSEQDYYILTNGHVTSGGQRFTVELFDDGYKTVELEAKRTWHMYRRGTSIDASVLSLPISSLQGYKPHIIPLAPKTVKLKTGDKVYGSGCPAGRWNQWWAGRVTQNKGFVFYLNAPPEGGQSGTGVIYDVGDKSYLVGLLTWRIGQGNAAHGGGLTSNRIYDMINGNPRSDSIVNASLLIEVAEVVDDQICSGCKRPKHEHEWIVHNGKRIFACPKCKKHNLHYDEHLERGWKPSQFCGPDGCFPFNRPQPRPRPDSPWNKPNDDNNDGGIWPGRPGDNPKPQPKPDHEDCEKEIAQLKAKIAELEKTIADLRQQLQDAEDNAHDANLEKEKALQELKRQEQVLQNKINNLQAKLDQVQDNNIGLQGAVVEWKNQIDRFKRELEQLEKDKEKLLNQTEDLSKTKEQLEAEKKALEQEKQDIVLENEALKNEKDSLAEEKETIEREKNSIFEKLQSTEKTVKNLEDGNHHWLDEPTSGYGNSVENVSIGLGSMLLASFVAPWLSRKVGVLGSRIIIWGLKRAGHRVIEKRFGKESDETEGEVYNTIADGEKAGSPVHVEQNVYMNERAKSLFELKTHDGESKRAWALRAMLYKEAVSYLRTGKLEYAPGVKLQGQQRTANAIDSWVRRRFVEELDTETFKTLSNDELLREATVGFLYAEAVDKLRNGGFDTLNPRETADTLDDYVNKELLKYIEGTRE